MKKFIITVPNLYSINKNNEFKIVSNRHSIHTFIANTHRLATVANAYEFSDEEFAKAISLKTNNTIKIKNVNITRID